MRIEGPIIDTIGLTVNRQVGEKLLGNVYKNLNRKKDGFLVIKDRLGRAIPCRYSETGNYFRWRSLTGEMFFRDSFWHPITQGRPSRKGTLGYDHAVEITDPNGGIVAWVYFGGQLDTVHLRIPGYGCAIFEKLIRRAVWLLKPRITMLHIALDAFGKDHVKTLIRKIRNGKMEVRAKGGKGRVVKCTAVDPLQCKDVDGSGTIYRGSRRKGWTNHSCIYDKRAEQKQSSACEPWTRFENRHCHKKGVYTIPHEWMKDLRLGLMACPIIANVFSETQSIPPGRERDLRPEWEKFHAKIDNVKRVAGPFIQTILAVNGFDLMMLCRLLDIEVRGCNDNESWLAMAIDSYFDRERESVQENIPEKSKVVQINEELA